MFLKLLKKIIFLLIILKNEKNQEITKKLKTAFLIKNRKNHLNYSTFFTFRILGQKNKKIFLNFLFFLI